MNFRLWSNENSFREQDSEVDQGDAMPGSCIILKLQ